MICQEIKADCLYWPLCGVKHEQGICLKCTLKMLRGDCQNTRLNRERWCFPNVTLEEEKGNIHQKSQSRGDKKERGGETKKNKIVIRCNFDLSCNGILYKCPLCRGNPVNYFQLQDIFWLKEDAEEMKKFLLLSSSSSSCKGNYTVECKCEGAGRLLDVCRHHLRRCPFRTLPCPLVRSNVQCEVQVNQPMEPMYMTPDREARFGHAPNAEMFAYMENLLEKHVRTTCKGIITCRECKETVPFYELIQHLEYDCEMRKEIQLLFQIPRFSPPLRVRLLRVIREVRKENQEYLALL